MPIVKGKEFDYTKKGKAAAETAKWGSALGVFKIGK